MRPSEWSAADRKVAYETVWFGAPGAKLINDRRSGMPSAWPEYFLGSVAGQLARKYFEPMKKQLTALATMMAEQQGITEDRMKEIFRSVIIADVVPALEEVLGQAQADEIADRVVESIATRLSGEDSAE